jgi:hypothetical protein
MRSQPMSPLGVWLLAIACRRKEIWRDASSSTSPQSREDMSRPGSEVWSNPSSGAAPSFGDTLRFEATLAHGGPAPTSR